MPRNWRDQCYQSPLFARLNPIPASQHRVLTLPAAWETVRNAAGQAIDWRFTTADARIKLKRLYPTDGS